MRPGPLSRVATNAKEEYIGELALERKREILEFIERAKKNPNDYKAKIDTGAPISLYLYGPERECWTPGHTVQDVLCIWEGGEIKIYENMPVKEDRETPDKPEELVSLWEERIGGEEAMKPHYADYGYWEWHLENRNS